MGGFPDWIVTVIPVSVIFILALIGALCICSKFCWKCNRGRGQPTVPQNTDGPIHDPGIYNESFVSNTQPVFTIPGSAFMPYATGLPVNYVISSTRVITITADTDDEVGETDSQMSTMERRQYDNGVTLSVSTLPRGPPQYGSLYFNPPPNYEEALEITDIEDNVTHYV